MFNHSTTVANWQAPDSPEPPESYSIGGSVYKNQENQEPKIKVLGAGVDTLYHNYTLDPDVLAQFAPMLTEWKEAAQEANERFRLPLGGGELFMLPRGRGHYGYVVERPGVGDVMISYNKLFSAHPVRVRLSALFNAGAKSFEELEQAAFALVELLFGVCSTTGVQVSELHLAVDFTGYVPTIADWLDGRFVCPAGEHIEEVNRETREISSMRWSKHGSPISAVLYNKHKEVREQSTHKAFLLDKWRAGGWCEDDGDVFRLEFRFSREWLRERNINAPGEVDLASLLASGMSWLELRDPSATDTNRARWAVSAIWSALAMQASTLIQGLWMALKVASVPNVTKEQLAAQIGGCVACVGALVDHDNLSDLFAFVQSLFEQKLERSGQTLVQMVQRRRDRYMLSMEVA